MLALMTTQALTAAAFEQTLLENDIVLVDSWAGIRALDTDDVRAENAENAENAERPRPQTTEPRNQKRAEMSYALTTTVRRPFVDTLEATRQALSDEGFGILTEIDIQVTLKAKLDVDVQPQVILGACRPPLAHAALQVEPSVGLLLPCNVVIRAIDDDTTVVEALDPKVMVTLTQNEALSSVATEAGQRLAAALDTLTHAPANS